MTDRTLHVVGQRFGLAAGEFGKRNRHLVSRQGVHGAASPLIAAIHCC